MTTNVLDLAEKYVVAKKVSSNKGGEYHSPCPGCHGTDRFHVWPEENNGEGSYWCRQCNKTGDAIQFLRDFENLSFQEACARLGKEIERKRPQPFKTPQIPTQLQAPPSSASASDSSAPSASPRRAAAPEPYAPGPATPGPSRPWRDKAAAFVDWCHSHLMYIPPTNRVRPATPGAMECRTWLEARGINDMEMKHFRLGFNPGENGADIFRPRQTWGLEPDIKPNGQPKRLWFPIGLVIPLYFEDQVLRIRIRRPHADDPRYYIIPGSDMRCLMKKYPYGRFAYIIVESELDAILIDNQASDMTGVIALGNASRKPDVVTWAALSTASSILVALDADKAGQDASQWWLAQYPQARLCPVPQGKDPGEAYQQGVDIRAWIQSHLPKGWFL
jgi:DNA primase